MHTNTANLSVPQTIEELTREIRAIREKLAARIDGTPNLRDYGLDRRDDFEAAIAAYHAETARLETRMQELGWQRLALRRAEVAR